MAFSADDQQDAEGEFLADASVTRTGRRCACLDSDARTCWDLRYYGRSPVMRGQAYAEHYYVMQATLTAAELDDGECQCLCHEVDEDEEAGDGDD